VNKEIIVGDRVAVACARSINQKYRGDIVVVEVVSIEKHKSSTVWHLSDETRVRSSSKMLKIG